MRSIKSETVQPSNQSIYKKEDEKEIIDINALLLF